MIHALGEHSARVVAVSGQCGGWGGVPTEVVGFRAWRTDKTYVLQLDLSK